MTPTCAVCLDLPVAGDGCPTCGRVARARSAGRVTTEILRLAEEADVDLSELATITVAEFADRLAYARSRREQADRLNAERLGS